MGEHREEEGCVDDVIQQFLPIEVYSNLTNKNLAQNFSLNMF